MIVTFQCYSYEGTRQIRGLSKTDGSLQTTDSPIPTLFEFPNAQERDAYLDRLRKAAPPAAGVGFWILKTNTELGYD